MKYFLFALVLSISTSAFSQFSRDQIKNIKSKLPKGLSMEVDQFNGLIWIKHKDISAENSFLGQTSSYFTYGVYFGIREDGTTTPMRFKGHYWASSWLFIKETIFIVGMKPENQERFKIACAQGNTEVHSGGNISEYIDCVLTDEGRKLVDHIADVGGYIQIQVQGDAKKNNFTMLGGRAQKNFKTILDYYDSLQKVDRGKN